MVRARLLIACTGNSARSQIAEGLFCYEAGDRLEVFSAGTERTRIRPEAIGVMNEIGIDISEQKAKSVEPSLVSTLIWYSQSATKLSEKCPVFPQPVDVLHWTFEDRAREPEGSEARFNEFRPVRDRLHARIMVFRGEVAPGLERGKGEWSC